MEYADNNNTNDYTTGASEPESIEKLSAVGERCSADENKDKADGGAQSSSESGADGSKQNGRSLKSKLLLGLGIALLIVLAALIVKRLFFTADKIESNPLSTVSVGHAKKADVSIESSLIGSVQPSDVYYVVPKVSGEVIEIFVSVGDVVEEGNPICTIDNSKAVDAAKIQLDSAEVQLNTALDARNLAKTNLDRMAALYQTGDISKQSFEQTQNAYDQAQAAADAAGLQRDAAKLQYDTQTEFSTVTAPVTGTVESTNMSINGLVSSASQVCVISSEGEKKVVFNATDRLLSAFKPGTLVTVTKQGSEYGATVTNISTLPDAATGLYRIEAAFTEHNSIVNGSSVKLSFISEEHKQVLTVDTDDITYDGGLTYVYTLSYNDADEAAPEGSTIGEGNRAGTVHKTEVETGLSNNKKTEIISGIDADRLLITSWTSQLYEGAQVQVLPEA